jgi:hypothetical protein
VVVGGAAGPDVTVGPYDTWTVGRDGIYVFVVRGATNPPAVWLYPWNGPARKLREVGGGGDIGVAADGRALFSQYDNEQVDLGLFELTSN